MKRNEGMPEVAGIFSLRSAIVIDMTKYISKTVKVINMATFRNVLAVKLPKREAKLRDMYDHHNCLA